MENQEKDDNYYINLADNHLGCAIRDNSKREKVEIGKAIDEGTWDTEEQ